MKVGEHMAGRGQPKKFKSGEQLIDLWKQFCKHIKDNEYTEVPTQTNFEQWLNIQYKPVTVRTIYNALNEYFPTIKKDFESVRADLIAEGAMLGRYQPTISIFALKNWCKWTDKQEVTQFTVDDVKQDALSKSLEEMAEDLESDD